ncbi:flavin monoamine oxidase family protein [Prosthecomicrobium pneumaticum]|uniref:Tryptophan 2-monooxygenase n=1 Tax=Prosthecomicrobium pneumaticum TaxID=81895 RepID=A0A7W9FLX7_9HYPH|nr:NAD(P)/FAD-dependent oxidoreductase [Prosthecomicrobium pneumaticum]MBB5753074.1 monoamine oxidase [Prosthecomicrobium pneumaticum]
MSGSDVEVVVIGGGAAGIAAARRLHEAGVDTLLVEARDRLGGRGYTIADGRGHAIDLGCGWLHSADHNPFVAIAEAQGAVIDRTPPPWSRPMPQPGFNLADQEAFGEAFEAFDAGIATIGETGPDRPAAAFLERGGRWNALLDAVSGYYSGAPLARVSARDLDRYVDEGVDWRIPAGYGAVIAAHAASLRVALGRAVETIDHSGRRLTIETADGPILADRVIVTLPASLIAEEAVRFRPALPDKVEAARGLPLGLADKLFLTLEAPQAFAPDSRLIGRPDRTETASYHMRPFGRPQIEVYFGGDLADALEDEGEAGFVDFARAELVGLFGADFARHIAPLAHHGWRRDPFARGAYSYALPGRADDRARLAAPVDGRLFFAGEACSRHDFSTAHGALRTGLAAAEALLAMRAGAGA